MKESSVSRCTHENLNEVWLQVPKVEPQSLRLSSHLWFLELLGFYSLYIKGSRSYFNGSEIPKINIIKMDLSICDLILSS